MSDNSQLNSPLLTKRAKEFAGAWYEKGEDPWGNPFSERFYAIWPDVETFIGRNWPKYLEAAYQYHATLLGAPEGLVPPEEKRAIFEDMQAYNERRMRQRPTKVGIGPLMLRPDQPGTLERKLFHSK